VAHVTAAHRDLIAGLVCLATSLVLLALTYNLPGPSLLVPIGPGFYPRIVLGITAVLSAALVVQSLLARRGAALPKTAGAPEYINYRLVLATFAIFGLYVGFLPYLGYRVATFLFVGALQAILEPPAGARSWGRVLIVAVATAAATYYTFEGYLSVLLPRGLWTDF
jgi:putative tricarboxylic transport membrane protein